MSGYLNALQQLLRDPASNLTAAVVGVSIIVLLVLIGLLAVVGAVLFQQISVEEEEAEAAGETVLPYERTREQGPPSVWSRTADALTSRRAITIIITLLVLGVLVSVYAGTSSNDYCGNTCHSMVSASDSWKRASHKSVACVRCHEGMPGLSAASGTLLRTRDVVSEVMGRVPSSSSVVSPGTCLQCHASVRAGTIESVRGVRVRHSDFLAAGASCVTCHTLSGHKGKTYEAPSVMSECLRCHDGKHAPSACAECHVGDIGRLPLVERTRVPIRLPQPTCGGCHSQQTCDACHGMRMPHPENWADPKQHAMPGSFSGRVICYRCHTFIDCEAPGCHTIQFDGPKGYGPHGPNWNKRHQTVLVKDAGHCSACHTRTTNICLLCHPKLAGK
jgi:hypothetical protein